MRIEHLADNFHWISILAGWHQTQFGYLNPSVTIDQRTAKLTASAQKGQLPITLVAVRENELLGSASLLAQTIMHQHLSPWLSSVYVDPAHRGKGVGSALVRQVVREAAHMGMAKLYLFTPNSEALYQKLGWEPVEYSEYRGSRITIMSVSASA